MAQSKKPRQKGLIRKYSKRSRSYFGLFQRVSDVVPVNKTIAFAGLAGFLLATSGCSLFGPGKAELKGDIKPGNGAYSVYYTDIDTNHGNATTVNEDGSLVATAKLNATNLFTRIDSSSTVGLFGARSADLVFINADGSVDTGFLDYPEGTGVTASTWLGSDEIASLVNVGQTADEYSNPLVIHDRSGKTLRSLQIYGFMQSAIMNDEKLYLAGEIVSADPQDSGSRVITVDPKNMSVLDQHDWRDTGGLQSCAMSEGMLFCLESDKFGQDDYPEFSWNKLVKIDPTTWEKTPIKEFKDVGVTVQNLNGKVYVLLEHRLSMISPDGKKIAAERDFGDGEDAKAERLSAAPDGELDLYVRDFSFADRGAGKNYVGDVFHLNPSTLETESRTPMELPGEQFVDLHAISADFFSVAK
ncbi:hypothetical protein [Arthrobacter sp. NIO-1057]|uniref:hypothetical protein n=1 Tax=Arthrobacter sp. NIO-1057 TaxID=993071 RepID=UPI000817822B|nr:hypothetical protein [Arthrobacter sp. NIO-1057]SCC28022.1 hypothetical protein GA0061084_1954 [Arthrobacter sp. NIO-1057]